MPSHSEKIEQSGVAYLTANGASLPDTLKISAGVYRIFPGESDSVKDAQCILWIMDTAQEEFPEKSGNRYSIVRVELHTPVRIAAPGETDVDALEDHEEAVTALEQLLLVDDLAAQLSAAIANFTVMGILDRQPIEEETDDYWMNGYEFRIYSCPSSV